ncbi:MAG: S41 family peptidase [Nannocystaceae bacterium]
MASACGPNRTATTDGKGDQAKAAATASATTAAATTRAPGECPDLSDLDPTTLPPLPESPYAATLDAVWRVVLQKHFDPTLACLDWPALRLEYGAKLVDAESPTAAYELMNELLDKLGQSHFKVVPPAPADATEAPRGGALAPLAARLIGDEVVVVDAAVGGVDSGVPQGAVLLEVAGESVPELVARIKARSERPSERAFEVSRAVENLLSGDEGDAIALRLRDPKAADAEVTREVRCVTPAGEVVSLGNLRDIPTVVDGRMIEGTKIGYLAFNYWMLPMLKQVESTLGELREAGMESLILDLRGNPGGVGAMSVPLARMLLTEGGSLGTLKFRDFKQDFNVAGNPDAFTGRLVILVDEGTASTSEIFATGMRDLGRVEAVVGGRASAGAALPSLIERLDGGVILQYVVGDYHSSKGSVAEGDGVRPDLLVEETRDDFIAGRDPVLAAAIEALSSAPSKN